MPSELAIPDEIVNPARDRALAELSRQITPSFGRRTEARKDVEAQAYRWLCTLCSQDAFKNYRMVLQERIIPEILASAHRVSPIMERWQSTKRGILLAAPRYLTPERILLIALRVASPRRDVLYYTSEPDRDGHQQTHIYVPSSPDNAVSVAVVNATLPLLRIPRPMPNTDRERLWTAMALLSRESTPVALLKIMPPIVGTLDPKKGTIELPDDATEAQRHAMERQAAGYARLLREEKWDGRHKARSWRNPEEFRSAVADARRTIRREGRNPVKLRAAVAKLLEKSEKTVQRAEVEFSVRVQDVKPRP
jgi:hypothetical protein